MRLFLTMAFGLLAFASVAWGQHEGDVVPEVAASEPEKNTEGEKPEFVPIPDPENVEPAEDDGSDVETENPPDFDEVTFGCSDPESCGPNDIQSGFDVVTGDLGMIGNASPDANNFTLQTLVNGFNVSRGVIGSGVGKAVTEGDAGIIESIDSGFNASTGEFGLPMRKFKCYDKAATKSFTSYGQDYRVLYNVSPMTEEVSCGTTITYATSTELANLENLSSIIDSWQAPMSIALHASGTDFQMTIDSIRFLKSCGSPLISQFVSFHIYWHEKHPPEQRSQAVESLSESYDCEDPSPLDEISRGPTYKQINRLRIPKNIGHDIAKRAAVTHYMMVADYGFYASNNLASEFIEVMTWNTPEEVTDSNPKAFVLMHYEIDSYETPPANKAELMNLVHEGSATEITKGGLCGGEVSRISVDPQWIERPMTREFPVSGPLRRKGRLQFWSPVFISTASVPDFDERLSVLVEKPRDWLLCAKDYEYFILNNAFVATYRQHIEAYDSYEDILDAIAEDTQVMQNVILPEYQEKYGRGKECVM